MGSTAASQSAQLPASKVARPEYPDIHAHVLHDLLTRLDRAFHAFFRPGEGGRDAWLSALPRRQPLPPVSPPSRSAPAPHSTTASWCSPRSAG
ncbi:MAG TPA: hypothetical protein VGS80_17330, partial [Ktedonobacterales bacterium]|nr:hypothetical protein [Ktedonobacterales bacterium]